MAPTIAFLDTMPLIWWIRREASPGQDEMVKRANWLMDQLERDKADVMISEISVAEFLRGSNKSQRRTQHAKMEESFIIRPFDARAAQVAADRFEFAATLEDYLNRKTVMKADLLIVATAIASGADVLYSHDKSMRKMADAAGIEARDLPLSPSDLWGYVNGTESDAASG